MKIKIFILTFITVSILLCVSCGKKQGQTQTVISERNEIIETEISEISESTINDSLSETAETELTETTTNDYIENAAALIIKLVKNRDKEGLSQIIRYPLKRTYPIPPVKNEKEFIERFDEIFVAELLEMISYADPKECWGSFGWRGIYMIEKDEGILSLYLGFDCNKNNEPVIYSINTCSNIEQRKCDMLIEAEQEDLHESLKTFIYPVVLMETPTHLIRIDCIKEHEEDYTQNVFRYASWKKGSSISDKPDLILTNGVEKVSGSGFYGSYSFINGKYNYVCCVGMWGDPQYIYNSFVLGNIKSEEKFHGDLILYHEGRNIKLLYWSEERELRKPKKESGQD